MTRNNLGPHLTWLLQVVAANHPTTRSTLYQDLDSSRVVDYLASESLILAGGSQSSITWSVAGQSNVRLARSSHNANQPTNRDEIKDESIDVENMGRLESARKPKKALLVSRVTQLPTPVSDEASNCLVQRSPGKLSFRI